MFMQITEDGSEDGVGVLRPLVSTKYPEWCCKYFAQPTTATADDAEDFESPRFYQREYRCVTATI